MKWEYEEGLLLVDLYDRLNNIGEPDFEITIYNFRNALQQRASMLGYKCKSSYRSFRDITDKLDVVKDIVSQNTSNFITHIDICLFCYKYFIDDYSSFCADVESLKLKYHLDLVYSEKHSITAYYHDYELNPTYFKHISIRHISEFSPRTLNGLTNNSIRTVFDLLNMNEMSLLSLKNIGITSVKEIEAYIQKLSNPAHASLTFNDCVTNHAVSTNIARFKDEIFKGDFSFVETLGLGDKERDEVDRVKVAYNILGRELVELCINNDVEANLVSYAFHDFYYRNRINKQRIDMLYSLLSNIPQTRHNKSIMHFFKSYSSCNTHVRYMDISPMDSSESFISYFLTIKELSEKDFITLSNFLEWCSFNISDDCEAYFSLLNDDKQRNIITMRAQGATLDEVGVHYNASRQRIEQVENSIIEKFSVWNSVTNILGKIYSEEDGNSLILPHTIREYVTNHYEEIIYLLKVSKSDSFNYKKELDVFVVYDDELIDLAYACIDTLPNVIRFNEKSEFVNRLHTEYYIPKLLLELIIEHEYRLTADTLHRTALTYTAMCENILSKHFKQGIMLRDSNELDQFKQLLIKTYGDIRMPPDKSLQNIITRIGILCGISKYKPKLEQYIPEWLELDISSYIIATEDNIIHTYSIFKQFREILEEYDIDNKYYFHGVLKEIFQHKYAFKRDYLSKTDFSLSVYSRIHDYIIESKYSVSKQELNMAFPELTDVMLANAIQCEPNILNFYGQYLHTSKLGIQVSDIDSFRTFLTSAIQNNNVCHNLDLFNIIKYDNPNLLSKLGIYNQHSLFSLLEYLFYEEYNFVRPYIALPGVTIERKSDILDAIILESDEILIDKIKEFARQNYIQIPRIITYINQFSETHLFKDSRTLIKEKLVGINNSIIEDIECKILVEIDKTTLLVHLSSIYSFSTIDVPWNEWILYSILRKYSTKLDVSVTSNRLFHATPVVAAKGTLSLSEIKSIPKTKGDTLIVDLSDNFDDYWDYELGEENEL